MLLEKIKKNIIDKGMIKQTDRVVVGVSGGADSVCLLISLLMLQKEIGFDLVAAHLNHGIRQEADADEAFVRKLCECKKIKFVSKKVNVEEISKREGLSIEEAGRKERYKFFREVASGDKIAVAHNLDDQEETILFNAVRGSSLAGLSGMKEISGDVIRPLLNISRKEIEEFLSKIGQDYITDKTNLEDNYSRNKIRHNVLPYLKGEINEGAGRHLVSLANKAREADEFVAAEARRFIEENNVIDEGSGVATLEVSLLKAQVDLLKKKIVYECICEVAKSKKDVTEKHVEIVLGLIELDSSAKANLPYGIVARREYEKLVIQKAGEKIDAPDLTVLNKSIENARVFCYEKGMPFSQKEFTKWFDYDKIKGSLVWRFREEGDIISLAKTGTKKINRLMIDEKIPSEKRNILPLLADGKNILWIPGYRINEDYKVTDETKHIIEIIWEG